MSKLSDKIKNRPKKGTKLQQNLGVSEEEMNKYMDTKYTIDVNKKTSRNKKPRFTD